MLDFEFASRWIKECTKNDKPYGNLAKKTQWHTEWTGGDKGGAAPLPPNWKYYVEKYIKM